jgi:hypothetical protein
MQRDPDEIWPMKLQERQFAAPNLKKIARRLLCLLSALEISVIGSGVFDLSMINGSKHFHSAGSVCSMASALRC